MEDLEIENIFNKINNNKEILNCVGKIVCFWRTNNGLKGKPYYYECIMGVSTDKQRIKMKIINNQRDEIKWSKPKWNVIDNIQIENGDWYYFDKKYFKKIRLLFSLDNIPVGGGF